MTRDTTGCDEYRNWTRRRFLGRAAIGAAATFTSATWMPQVLCAGVPRGGGGRDVLIYILLRGGIDGLSTVVPYGDGDLYLARPNLAVQPPGETDGAIDLDGFFGLNPVAAPLMGAWTAGRLAFVHAAGSPDPSRSHFDAFKKMEGGIANQSLSAITEGWMSRHLLNTPSLAGGPLRCLSVQDVLPTGLDGAPNTVPVNDLADYPFPGDPATEIARKATLASMFGSVPAPLGPAASNIMGTIDLLGTIDFTGYVPSGSAVYPQTDFGLAMSQCAALIKADVGAEVLMIELDGFDHHATLGPISGDLATLLDDLSRGLAAFDTDMGTGMDSIVVAAHSEFGRRVAENASAGADHGHGGIMLLMGGSVVGGQVHGSWPGLAPAFLDDGDLAMTTDYRDVMGEVLVKRIEEPDVGAVFPGHVVSFPGVIV
jgi:uncharacterized protein (DUF1501 family)